MASPKAGPSFATEVEVIPLTSYERGDKPDGRPRGGCLRRASTDAQTSEVRPRPRVRFHTLASGMERQVSNEAENLAFELLSVTAHQIGPANLSGGWQNTIFTRRRKGLTPQSEEEEVLEIAQAMEEDQRLMADDVDGEVLRRDALRELPKSLKVKKEIKERLTLSKTSARKKSKRKLSYFKNFQYMSSMKWYRLKETIKMAWRDYSLWHKDLKEIEGIYGSSVGSYFRFLRCLFLVDFLVALVIISILLVPQIHYGDTTGIEAYSNNVTESPKTTTESDSTHSNFSFGLLDWLTGAGWFSDTKLYYGGYSTGILNSRNSILPYNMPKVYFFTITSCFILCFIILLYRIFTMYRANYIDTPGDLNVLFVEIIVSAWDFNITDEKAASVKRRSIYNELMEMLQEYEDEEEIEGFFKRIGKRILKCLVWFVLVSFLLLLGAGLYLLLKDQLYDLSQQKNVNWKESLELLVYPMIVTLLMVVIPMVFEAIGRMEKYAKPRYELYANLVRVILLELVVLMALVIFWYEKSPGLREELKKSLKQTMTQSDTEEDTSTANQTIVDVKITCWESALGEEIYRLVFIDFLVMLVSTLVVDRLKPILVRSGKSKENILQFSIPRNTLHIIYNQTLMWAGLFFCPLLPLIVSLKFSLIFFLQKFSVTKNLQPVDRPWRAAQMETIFYTLTLFTLILAFLSYVFIVIKGYCSPSCGPFQGFMHYKDVIWDADGGTEKTLVSLLTIILRPGSLCLFTLILCLVVYCVKNLAEGRAQLVSVLRNQLEVESKDRAFLQRLIEKVQKGEYNPRMKSPTRVKLSPSADSPLDEASPKRLTKRSSFVFSRNSPDEVGGSH